LGDSIRGYRIIGTEPAYLDAHGATIAQGRAWRAPMEVVLGDTVAGELAADLGAQLTGTHGLSTDGEAHAATPYTVVGRLRPCGCVLDRLALTSLESVWTVHEHHDGETAD